jgi:hypothetical protein
LIFSNGATKICRTENPATTKTKTNNRSAGLKAAATKKGSGRQKSEI